MLTWLPAPMSMELTEGSYIATLEGLHVFTAKRRNRGYRLRTLLKGFANHGKLCYCNDLDEVKQRSDEELERWILSNGLINPTLNAIERATG